MSLFTRLASLKRNLFHRKRADADLDAELRSYADLLADENSADGATPAEAHRRAQIEFGGIEQVKENVRDSPRRPSTSKCSSAICVSPSATSAEIPASRSSSSSRSRSASAPTPPSSASADAIILRPIPVPNAGDVIVVDTAASKLSRYGGNSYLDYLDFCARSKSFESLAIAQQMSAGMNTSGCRAQ